jgi:hypothetical protein
MANTVTPINLPFPDEDDLELRIALGPCRVRIRPGSGGAWAAGSYEDVTGVLPIQVTTDGGHARIAQAPLPSVPTSAKAPSLDLELGTARPFQLVIDGGANETVADLGGVRLTRVVVHYGAGRAELDFSAPNPAEMASLDVSAGGASVDVRSIANANLSDMVVSGGAGQYRLDFGGTLRRDAEVRLNAGIASIELRLPASTAATVRTESILGSIDVGDGFTTRDGAYWNQAAGARATPVVRVRVNSVLGAVTVRST